METLNYYDLKKEYKKKQAQEKTQNLFKQEKKTSLNQLDDKRSNLSKKQEFWEYLNKCPINN